MLDMNGRKGKVGFAKALELIDDDAVRFLDLLSKLRNRCAHGVRQAVEFTLPWYVEGLSAKERKEVVFALRGRDGGDKTVTIARKKVTAAKFALDNPKIEIWLTSLWILAGLYLSKELAGYVRKKERALVEQSFIIKRRTSCLPPSVRSRQKLSRSRFRVFTAGRIRAPDRHRHDAGGFR